MRIPACLARGLLAAALAAALLGGTIAPAAMPSSTAATSTDASSQDIRDIRGPKIILPQWLLPALLAAGALLAGGAYAAWRWNQRRRLSRVRLPFEIALQGLEDSRALMHPPSVREFSTAVSDIVRRYIEHQFHAVAAHRTTEEFLHDLLESSNASLARHHDLLSAFLQQCDLAKFAGLALSRQGMESLYQSARTFVLEAAKPVVQTQGASSSSSGTEAHDSLPSA